MQSPAASNVVILQTAEMMGTHSRKGFFLTVILMYPLDPTVGRPLLLLDFIKGSATFGLNAYPSGVSEPESLEKSRL